MKLLFIFMDGVGLGTDNPEVNPFVHASLPTLDGLLDGDKIIANGYHNCAGIQQCLHHNDRISLLSLDACLGVEGLPQSASGQASLLTGKNVSLQLGFHDGPKPSQQVMEILQKGTLFSQFKELGRQISLLNAYPPRYFKSIHSGYRLPGVIALSAMYAGVHLRTQEDLQHGEAISVDFTARGWHDQLGLLDTPLLDLSQAGERIACLSNDFELAFFEYWLTDVVGHRQDLLSSCEVLEKFDSVLGSLLRIWDNDNGLILITSDHGNIEDLSTRHHTQNDVPLILIGSLTLRELFINQLEKARRPRTQFDLTDIAPALLNLTGNH